MKHPNKWKASKFIFQDGRLKPAPDRTMLAYNSHLAAWLTAECYSRYIPQFARGKLLDLGCGKIPFYEAYRPYIRENICIDWENSLHPNENLDFCMDICQPLPFENNTFQTIICSDVLEHIFEPMSVLDEMVRVCDAGGHILINTPFLYRLHEEPYDYHRYTKHFFQLYAEQNPCIELVDIQQLGDGICVLFDILLKLLPQCRIMKTLSRGVYILYKRRKPKRNSRYALGFFVIYRKCK